MASKRAEAELGSICLARVSSSWTMCRSWQLLSNKQSELRHFGRPATSTSSVLWSGRLTQHSGRSMDLLSIWARCARCLQRISELGAAVWRSISERNDRHKAVQETADSTPEHTLTTMASHCSPSHLSAVSGSTCTRAKAKKRTLDDISCGLGESPDDSRRFSQFSTTRLPGSQVWAS